ncbi:MAG: Dinitrogenase iron-molybdenum cofactor [Bacteroidetes bacterium ADurb.Bin041]|nr:MAG: Dinitrogenase iron-molybdenum cofactor [Bacteroidetes bacterium ADurb.Bin041]
MTTRSLRRIFRKLLYGFYMKIAITSTGNNLKSNVDSRFGRCAYFVIYDTVSQVTEFIPNPNLNVNEGAGPSSVQLVAKHKVSKVFSGEFGGKVKSLFDSLNIQMVVIKENKTIEEIIEMQNL